MFNLKNNIMKKFLFSIMVLSLIGFTSCSSSKSLAETKSYQKDGLIGKTNNRNAYYPAYYCTNTKIRKKDEWWRPKNWIGK